MTILTVPEVPEEVHRALRTRAARHGRSTEAEVLVILQESVMPDLSQDGRPLAQSIAALGKQMLNGISLVTDEMRPLVEGAVQSQKDVEVQPSEQQAKDWASSMVDDIHRKQV